MPAELDPTGANTVVLPPPEPPQGENEALAPYPTFSDPANPGTTYSIDGIPVPADYFARFVNFAFHGPLGFAEAAARASARVRGRRITGVHWGTTFEIIYDENGRVVSIRWGKFDPNRRGENYSKETLIYDSWNLNLLPQNAFKTDNPETIDNKGQRQDCNISVSFTGKSINDMKNGENYYQGNPGLGFTVSISGLGQGGMASIGENKVDPKGRWILQQLMNLSFWTVRKGDTAPQTGYVETFSDRVDPASIIRWDDKSGGWIDHPGPNFKNAAGQQLEAHHSKWNFLIKAYNGKKECHVAFHAEMTFSNGNFHVQWGPGLY